MLAPSFLHFVLINLLSLFQQFTCRHFLFVHVTGLYWLPICHKLSVPFVYSLGICAPPYCNSSIFLPIGQMRVLETHRSSICHHLVFYFVGDVGDVGDFGDLVFVVLALLLCRDCDCLTNCLLRLWFLGTDNFQVISANSNSSILTHICLDLDFPSTNMRLAIRMPFWCSPLFHFHYHILSWYTLLIESVLLCGILECLWIEMLHIILKIFIFPLCCIP